MLVAASMACTSASRPVPPVTAGGGRPKSSPLARRIAVAHGIELAALAGSGPGGRIVRADVEAYVREQQNGNGKVEAVHGVSLKHVGCFV